MSKRTLFTTVTSLPSGITRETVLETLHNHVEMIDLNPLVTERHPIKPPHEASPEEYHAQWYSVTDKVNYLPGGLYSGAVTFNGCFHDLPNGLQTHIYAPMGLNMRGRWTLGGSLPGEPREAVELGLGVPKTGLWLREDVDMKCNFIMTKFVKGTTKKAHETLVHRLVEKAHIVEARTHNSGLAEQLSLREGYPPDYHAGIVSPTQPSQYFDGKPLNLGSASPPPVAPQYSGGGAAAPAGLNQSYFNPHGQEQQNPRFSYGRNSYPESGAAWASGDTKQQYPQQIPQQSPQQTPNQLNTNHFAVELPSQGTRTPTELDSSGR